MFAPLQGHNLVRLVYLDEAGIDRSASVMCVAGVLVHGDVEWPEVDRRLVALIEKHIPPEDRIGFFFHATDIYHGSKYFDRRKPEWADAPKRHALLDEIADIIGDLHLPVVSGQYRKDTFGSVAPDVVFPDEKFKDRLIHQAAILDCLVRADAWLARFAPDELATVVHEDGNSYKGLIKYIIRRARSAEHMVAEGVAGTVPGLPLQRIIDTVHFAEKPDARPLQLADLCAFILGRSLKGNPVPPRALEIIHRHLRWVVEEVPIVYPAVGVSADQAE